MPIGFKGYQKGHKGFRKYPPKVDCTCVTCGVKFVRRPCEVSRYCGHPCYAKSRIGVGRKRITKACEQCGVLFEKAASQIGSYCSRACADTAKLTKPSDRLWPRVQKADGDACWLWRGAVGTDGYGKFWYKGTTTHAHRAAWEVTNGPIPEGLVACHRCDTPLCVRPDHLFLGTHLDNTRDMIAKGRRVSRARLRVTIHCQYCDCAIETTPSRAKHTRFCSMSCNALNKWHPEYAVQRHAVAPKN